MKLKTAENFEKRNVRGNKNHWQFTESLTDFAFEEAERKRGEVVSARSSSPVSGSVC
jgi:hypothetical protein